MIALLNCAARVAEEGHEGFDPLGIDWGAAFWTWIIFLLALPFMWKVVYGPITKALWDRDRRADDAIARAEEAKDAAEKARRDIEAQLAEARLEAQRQVRQARDRAQAQAKELLDQARREAAADRQKAIAEIDAEKRRAIVEIRDLAVDVSLDAASRLLGRDMRADDQRTFVEGFLGDVEVLSER